MPYTRRKTRPENPDRQDFEIRCEGRDIGRVYLTRVPEGDRWRWSIYMNNGVPQIEGVPIMGLATKDWPAITKTALAARSSARRKAKPEK